MATVLAEKVEETRVGFEAAMDDDFNTPGAIGQLFELVRVINQARDAGVRTEALNKAQEDLRIYSGVLGLELEVDQVAGHEAASFIDLLIEVRQELRHAQHWALADLIRDRLEDLDVILEDGKGETTWRIG
jgi:cysteinyl-tRNA synthetase